MITWLLSRFINDSGWLVTPVFFAVFSIIELILFIGLGTSFRIKRQMAWPKTIGLFIAGDILLYGLMTTFLLLFVFLMHYVGD